jgi:hypothetical protein
MSDQPLTLDDVRRLRAAFKMPSVQTMMSRKSSITNAFVSSLIPVVEPTPEEIAEALQILGMSPDDVRCAYCGDRSTEWDHLRPLVLNRRPTGYISEIANLVPACGKCNQSKGNKNWLTWMTTGNGKHSPVKRGVPDLDTKVERLRAYEAWRHVVPVPFEQIVGTAAFANYWARMDQSIDYLRECHDVAVKLKVMIAEAHGVSRARLKATLEEAPKIDSENGDDGSSVA